MPRSEELAALDRISGLFINRQPASLKPAVRSRWQGIRYLDDRALTVARHRCLDVNTIKARAAKSYERRYLSSGRYWARTSDLLLVRQALYQLS